MTKLQHRSAWLFLASLAACVLFTDAHMVMAKSGLPLVERHSCQENPHRTIAFDNSPLGDKLYRGIFQMMATYNNFMPACTVGYDGKSVVVKIGTKFFKASVNNVLQLNDYKP